MKFLLLILGVLFCCSESVGFLPVHAPTPCQQECPSGADGLCSPLCADCVCCPHQQPMLFACCILPAPSLPIEMAPEPVAIISPSSVCNEILHIPETRLA